MLNSFEGSPLATAEMRLAVKLDVAAEASRSCPAGGSLAKSVQGLAWLHAICSGCEVAITAVCPGVSISCGARVINKGYRYHNRKIACHQNVDASL